MNTNSKVTFVIFIIVLILSCNKDNNSEFTSTYNKTDFNYFKNKTIYFRSSDLNYDIYFLSKKEGNFTPYFINYNKITGNLKIDRSLLIKNKEKDYFTDKEIKETFKKFINLNFYLLSVDKNENVYINPYETNAPASFLRINDKETIDPVIFKIFKKYNEKWYIRRDD